MDKMNKITRVLRLYSKLIKGENIDKKRFAIECGINERSVDRDIEDIRIFLSESYSTNELLYNKYSRTYYMHGNTRGELTGIELMALLKILISSKAFIKKEMEGLLGEIISLVDENKKKELIRIVKSELDNYKSPEHGKAILKMQWDLNKCILNHRKIKIHYCKLENIEVERIVLPISIVFSECYFYLIAFIEGKDYKYPAFFRVDRISHFEVLDEMYSDLLYEQYNVGNMKKSIQYMYAGDLIDVKLKCKSSIVENVLDRLQNSIVIQKDADYSIIKAEVFEEGFIKWILSQETNIEILAPEELRNKIYKKALDVAKLYEK